MLLALSQRPSPRALGTHGSIYKNIVFIMLFVFYIFFQKINATKEKKNKNKNQQEWTKKKEKKIGCIVLIKPWAVVGDGVTTLLTKPKIFDLFFCY